MRRKLLLAVVLVFPMISQSAPVTNDPVARIDPAQFAGRWYSLRSIPTFLDRNWRQTIENYTPRAGGGYDVFTTYRVVGKSPLREIRSVLFPTKGRPDGELRAQFFWPIRVPYRIVELTPDYMVGGSPDKKMLFILARQPSLPAATLDAIVERCRARGYAVERLTSQEHRP